MHTQCATRSVNKSVMSAIKGVKPTISGGDTSCQYYGSSESIATKNIQQ